MGINHDGIFKDLGGPLKVPSGPTTESVKGSYNSQLSELARAASLPKSSLELCMSICKWLTTIRGFCVVANPLCVYTRLELPNSYQINQSVKQVAVPSDVANVLVEVFNEIAAREAALSSIDSSLVPPDTDSMEWPMKAPNNKPWRLLSNRWEVTRTSPVRLSDSLVRCVVKVVCPIQVGLRSGAETHAFRLTSMLLARYYNNISNRYDVAAAPVTQSERVWLIRAAGICNADIIGDGYV